MVNREHTLGYSTEPSKRYSQVPMDLEEELKDGDDLQRVSLFSRVLAWIILAVFAIAVPAMIKQMLEGSWTMSRPATIIGVLSMIFILPLFFWVAIKGRAPRWWTPIDNLVKRDPQARRNDDQT